jgi:hypothetical protein
LLLFTRVASAEYGLWVEGGRLDRVEVRLTGRRAAVLSWVERGALLEQLRRLAGADSIVRAFEAVGASRAVDLSQPQKLALLGAIKLWEAAHSAGKSPAVPYGVLLLRDGLARELTLPG